MIYDQLLTLLTHTVFPFDASRTLILTLIATLLVSARTVSWRLPLDDPMGRRLNRWVSITLASLVITAVAGTIYAPAVPYYSPLELGIGNRVNALPAIGLIAATYGIYIIFGTLATRPIGLLAGPKKLIDYRWATTVAVILACLTGLRFAHLTRTDADSYDLASHYQLQTLTALRARLPVLAHNETLFTFGAPAYTAPGVPVFSASWDLDGAIQLTYRDPTINAYPIIQGSTILCASRGIAADIVSGPRIEAPYGHVVLYDEDGSRVSSPTTQSACRATIPLFAPGPLEILPPPAV
jgi:hypothetical protein